MFPLHCAKPFLYALNLFFLHYICNLPRLSLPLNTVMHLMDNLYDDGGRFRSAECEYFHCSPPHHHHHPFIDAMSNPDVPPLGYLTPS